MVSTISRCVAVTNSISYLCTIARGYFFDRYMETKPSIPSIIPLFPYFIQFIIYVLENLYNPKFTYRNESLVFLSSLNHLHLT